MADQGGRTLGVQFKGAVFSLYVAVEGREIDLTFDGSSTWERTIERFNIEGPLDLTCVAKGLSQTDCALKVALDGKIVGEFKGEISAKGVWQVVRSIPLTGAGLA